MPKNPGAFGTSKPNASTPTTAVAWATPSPSRPEARISIQVESTCSPQYDAVARRNGIEYLSCGKNLRPSAK